MFTYLKNMAGYKHNQLKNKSFDDIQKLFDKAIKRVNTFVDMDTELVEGSEVWSFCFHLVSFVFCLINSNIIPNNIKKQKVDEDKETAELQRLIEIIPDEEEVAIDAIPLETKPPSIRRIVGIKRLHDNLEVTAAKLMLLVQNLLLLVLKVNAAGIKVTTAGRVYADREEIKDLSEKE
ncbi:hypothetical protein Tco_1299648 [Tanacetum coccineum]